MKIFLLWDSKDHLVKKLIEKLQISGHQIVYWIGAPGGEIINPNSSTFHSSDMALNGLPAQDIENKFLPPSKDLIDKMHQAESLILTMMNAKHNHLGIEERKHLYYNMLGYWHDVLNAFRPDIVVTGIIPHAAHTYLIFELAKLLHIKTLMFEDSGVSDRLISYQDFRQGSPALSHTLAKNKGHDFPQHDLSPDLQKYHQLQTTPQRNATPVYIDVLKKRYSGLSLWHRKFNRLYLSARQGTLLRVLLQAIIRKLRPNLKTVYKKFQDQPDWNKKFIYFPLHLQPECTTSPRGDIFVDQLLALEILSVALPNNWEIYVKEHPIQWLHRGVNFSNIRYPTYYQKIATIDNVRLIPIETNTYALINKSQAVATITGIAGLEALFRNRPAIIFGYAWYRDCPGVLPVKNVESCRKALAKIKEGSMIKPQDMLNYLKAFDEATIHAYFDHDLKKNSQLNETENINNIIEKIILEINKIKNE